MNTQRIAFQGTVGKQYQTRIISESVGIARRLIPVKASRVAAIVGHSTTQESKVRSGERMSATTVAAVAVYEAVIAEACPIEAAGYCSAIIEFTLRAIAMWPELEGKSRTELIAELKREISGRETRANGRCNNLDSAFLNDEDPDLNAMLEEHSQQATASTRIAAILQILTRDDRR